MDKLSKMEENKVQLAFAAIDKTIIDSIPKMEEIETSTNKYISWGRDNLMPEFLYDLYQSVTTLSTIIEALSDFTTGNNVVCNIPGFEKACNRRGDS